MYAAILTDFFCYFYTHTKDQCDIISKRFRIIDSQLRNKGKANNKSRTSRRQLKFEEKVEFAIKKCDSVDRSSYFTRFNSMVAADIRCFNWHVVNPFVGFYVYRLITADYFHVKYQFYSD